MDSIVNSFALLGDEDGDDMAVLAERLIAKKSAVAAPEVAALDQSMQGNGAPSDYGRNDRGGRGREGYVWYRQENNGYYGDANRGYGYGGNQYRGQRGFYNDRHQGSGGNRNTTEVGADGWVQVRTSPVRGYGNQVYYNNRDDGRWFRNYGGDHRRGYDGGNRGVRGSQDGMNYARSDQSNNGDVVEDVNGAADVNAVDVEPTKAVSEGDAAPVTEQPTPEGSVKAEEGSVKADEEVAKLPREGRAEGSVKIDKHAGKEQEAANKEQEARREADRKYRVEYNKWRSLEEYEAVLAEKRKALETRKEERKVTADKDFKTMELVQKKKKEEALLKPEAPKLKKKPETHKLKKKDSLEKDEKKKDEKKTLSINEFLKPAVDFSYRPAGRGRGRGSDFESGRGGDLRNSYRAETGRVVGEFRNGGRADTGFRNGGRPETGRVGDSRNGGRAETGRVGDSRNGGHAKTGRVGDSRNGGRAAGELRNGGNRADSAVIKNKEFPGERGISKNAPIIKFEDQVEFPVLKGAARAV